MISTLFLEEKPRERCLNHGPESLSLRECLAILLGSGPKGIGCMGLAARLLEDENGSTLSDQAFFRIIHGDFRNRLASEPGIGQAKLARLLVTFEIARRYWLFERENEELSDKPNHIPLKKLREKIPRNFRYSQFENLGLVAQLPSGKLSSFVILGSGDEISVTISNRKLLQTLIYLKAKSFWLFHNHPDNSLEASPNDRELTKTLKIIARIIGIPLNGHWIVTRDQEIECLT